MAESADASAGAAASAESVERRPGQSAGKAGTPLAGGAVSDDEKSGLTRSGNGGVSAAAGGTVATFAAPVGIIEPPPEVKAVIDRTAEFVRKTGSAGEEQLLAKNRANRKFAFLGPQSPYHAYYRHALKAGPDSGAAQHAAAVAAAEEQRAREHGDKQRLEQEAAEEARTRRESEEREREASKPRTLQQRLQLRIDASQLDGPAVVSASSSAPPASVQQLQFHIPHPSHYPSSELDAVHLTALYASHLGGGFLSSLQQRERTNAAFDFLKPQHPLYAYYQGTRRAMDAILAQQTAPLLVDYQHCVQRTAQLLARLMDAARLRRHKQAEEEARQREAQEDTEVMAAIDWQSFVVVETVDFAADEEQYLPQPKRTVEEMEGLIAQLAIEEERDREERMRQEAERQERERREQAAMQLDAAAAAEAAATMQPPPTSSAAGVVIQHSEEQQLEVRTSAVPTVALAGASAAPTMASKLVTCVLCRDTIAAEDLEEHLRIELLDPKWKEQKQALIDRQRETSLVAGKSISDNLRRFERKKREIGRERTREEEERQDREDVLLLRGAARQDVSSTGAPLLASSAARHTAPTGALISAAAAAASSAALFSAPYPPVAADEPLPKRARPSSPSLDAAPTVAPTPSASSAAASTSLTPSAPRSSPEPLTVAEPPLSATSAARSAASSAPALSSAPASASAPSAAAAAAPKPAGAALVDERVWLSAHGAELSVAVRLRVPVDPTSPFLLSGQELSVRCRLTDTVDVLKAAVSAHCNALPANRQQFQLLTGGFLKEGHSLAYYNVFDGAVLNLKLKERGGKKK